jgi:pseudomonalisin/xanthomonalisin
MTFSSNIKMLPIAAMLVTAFGASAQAAETEWVKTESHALTVRNGTAGAMMKAGETIHVAVSLRLRNKEELDNLTSDLMAGRSTKILSREEFASRYAPTQDQVNAVVKHLTQSGFTNIKVAKNKMMVTADGTAGSAKSGFQVDLQHFHVTDHVAAGRSKEREAYANVNDPVVPKSLESIVLAVHGMQTVTRPHFNFIKAAKTQASGTATGHNPQDWPTIYGGTSLPTAANTTIGIITGGSMSQTQTDLQSFVQQAGFSMPATSVVGGGSSTSGTTEWDLDSQDSLGAAGGQVKSMIFYAAASMSDADLNSDYNQVVSDNVAKVINVSLGECETDAKSAGTEATDDQIFESAVAQGQTFVVASGDSGSYECGGSKNVQSYPAVSPYVIAVGGTEVYTSASGAWASETAWSCTSSSTCPQSASGGSGGGPSSTEKAPSYQISSKVLGTSTARGVPDVAFDASPDSGALPIVNGNATQVGGTSLATPIFTGFWARIQSAHNNSLSFPASAIYKYGPANESTIFHDITSGKNGGYSAKAGWDYVTGFGSLNVNNFSSFVNSHSGF